MDDVYIWQQDLWQKLTRNPQFLGHAVLLKGKRGIGKYHFARCLAKSLLCVASTTPERIACGQCHSCGWFEQNGHPNFYAILPEALMADAAERSEKENQAEKSSGAASKKNPSQQIGIDQIRKLNDFVYMTGHQEGYKIVLIYPAEAMNPAAANALLKKLEEPPENVVFMLVTHQAQHLLPTIRSRCRQIAMPMPDAATAIGWLTEQGVTDPEVSLAAAGYSPLAALALNEAEQARHYAQFVQLISSSGRLNPLFLAESMHQMNLAVIVNWLQQWCYDLVSYRSTGKVRYFLKQLPPIKALSQQIDLYTCLAYARTLNNRQQLAHHPLNPRLFLEELFIDYVAMIEQR